MSKLTLVPDKFDDIYSMVSEAINIATLTEMRVYFTLFSCDMSVTKDTIPSSIIDPFITLLANNTDLPF